MKKLLRIPLAILMLVQAALCVASKVGQDLGFGSVCSLPLCLAGGLALLQGLVFQLVSFAPYYKFRCLQRFNAAMAILDEREGAKPSFGNGRSLEERLRQQGRLRETLRRQYARADALLLFNYRFVQPLPARAANSQAARHRSLLLPPGTRLLRLAAILYSQRRCEEVFDQIVVDMREEYFTALAKGDKWAARFSRLRGCLAFGIAVARSATLAFKDVWFR